jgi:hypothetical protein
MKIRLLLALEDGNRLRFAAQEARTPDPQLREKLIAANHYVI